VQFTNFGELLVRRLSDGEVALDRAGLDDWDDAVATEPAGATHAAPEVTQEVAEEVTT
jgi:hypothetical protein